MEVTKKKKQTAKPQPIEEPMVEEVVKEVITSETGFLKRTKKPAKRPRHSPVRPLVHEPKIETT